MAKISRSSISADYKYLGKEPEFDGSVLTEMQLIRTYSWYNYFAAGPNKDASKDYIAEYAKNNRIKIYISNHDKPTFGWIARILTRGGKVSDDVLTRFNAYIQGLRKPVASNDDTPAPVESVKTNPLDKWIPDFEDAVDSQASSFSAYKYLVSNSVPQVYVKQIAEYYQPILDEAQGALNKVDKALTECYNNYSRVELKKYIAYLQFIIDDCARYLGNVKKERKPRKKKAKSTESLLKYFKYQQSHAPLKLTSENAEKIIGASALYALNTKYNTLTMYVAKDATGLTVNRTSIANIDEKQSMTKRVGRSVEKIVNDILNGTKRSRLLVLKNVKTDAIKLADRINENVILLKVDK